MNKLVIPIFATALAGLIGAPQTAEAGNGSETAAAIGGFVGGVIVGSHLGDRHDTVIIERDHHRHAPRGYWRYDTVRVWVPGRWIVRYDECGRRIRHFSAGHYEYRRERVWVATHDRHDHRRDRDGWRG